MELSPREVREVVLADHAALRVRIELLRRAIGTAGVTGDPAALRELLPSFLDHLGAHLALEDQLLAPTLASIDAWGPERSRRLAEEHAAQRAWIAASRERLAATGGDASTLAAEALVMIARVEEDMAQEEQVALDPRLYDDGVIQVDFSG
ncbi:MAG: hemerythrin domain-containing protein [Sandaracinaceae bacterium]|nr:hemerythrin domain-containing protein [Sandaracinaceae bacterium]